MPSRASRTRVRILADASAEVAADRVATGERPANGHISSTRADPRLNLGAGQPIPARDRGFFERRLGHDLSAVRVHRDAGVVSDLGAHALASGRDIAFAPGHWQPGSAPFRKLLGHELGHSLQQGAGQPAVQLDNGGPLQEAKAEQATGALEGGIKTIAEQAADNERLKSFGRGLAERYALPIWGQMESADKAAVIGTGVAIYGLGVGTLASDPGGRQRLSGVNLALPLAAIPYATLQSFSFVPPTGPGSPLTLRFGFSGDDLIKLAHDKLPAMPAMTLSFDMTMTIAPDGGFSMPFALAHIGLMPGLDVQAGFGVSTVLPALVPGSDGMLTPSTGFPQGPANPVRETAIFATVDLLKLPLLPLSFRRALGAEPLK
ncbi:DUF4157 domain-containing protein [Sphingobium sp. AP49]|uniref:eCIS core domain-containing protein n=1 Tax=Sphingobium sp. AP49 TaxID=1144307 RepID=UPI00026EDEE7|nr:DUF4157 domain-containing protein [Sphingobium sp. AP49]WHO39147.1 DUF4157 domain-containing protein [Sphingobium sp. AP49]